MRKVVVVDMGIISPLGNSLEENWKKLISGKSGISKINEERYLKPYEAKLQDFPTQIAGQVEIDIDSLEVPNITPRDIKKRMARFSQLAIAAASQLNYEKIKKVIEKDPYRVGVILGSGIGGVEKRETETKKIIEKKYKAVTPILIPLDIINITSYWISKTFKALGPNFGVVSACASGAHAISVAFEKIKLGYADLIITGGTEAPITPLGIISFSQAKALSTRNNEPEKASRPFDKNRDGFVLSEGAGILVLTNLETAEKYDFPILAEIIGIGETSDGFDLVAPDPQAQGAAKAMEIALKKAGILPEEIDYINAHGTSTPLGDIAEIKAIKKVFNKKTCYVSSTKSMTGHTLGAAGAIEAIFCVKALNEKVIPPTINVDEIDPECEGVIHVVQKGIIEEINYALSNSFGFGGHNISIIFKKNNLTEKFSRFFILFVKA